MHIFEFQKTFIKDKAISFFNETFKDLIDKGKQENKIDIYDEKNSLLEILKGFGEKYKNKTIITEDIKYFGSFIEDISNILLNMSVRLNRIEICLHANKCIARLNNNKEYIEDTRLIYVNSINHDLITLGGQDLSLFVLKLYDDKFKDLPLTSRCSFGTYLNDYESKRESIYKVQPQIITAIDGINLFIMKLVEIVKNYKGNTLNFVKHNILDIEPKPIEGQEIFNIGYINEKFIRPMLKLLFRYQDKNKKEYILGRFIEHNDNLFSIYELIINCPDTIK